MREVAIVGAGELGGLVAYALARSNSAGVIRLIDDSGRIAEGKALDISQAGPVEGFATAVAGSTGLSAAAGADVVVIADRVGSPGSAGSPGTAGSPGNAGNSVSQGEEALTLVRQLNAIAPRALLLCAGVSHRELVERSVLELRLPRARILGSASEAFVAAATAIIALEIDVSPRDVALSILGVPPDQIVIAWENAAVAGFALTGMMTEPIRRQLARRIAALWPVGPYALAAAACKVIEAVSGHSRRPVTCFVAPDDGAGVRTRAAALPVRLGPEGLVEVVMPRLSGVERVALDNAMML
jgi:malate dehydrogenase